jgi:ankyrin repeat protein
VQIEATVEQPEHTVDNVLVVPLLHDMALCNLHPHTELAECVRLLVEAGADINATAGRFQLTALMDASKSGCCSKGVQALLQHGANAS